MSRAVGRLALIVASLLLAATSLEANDIGRFWLIGRHPDTNPYGCTASASGTRVLPSGGAASITSDDCAVWTLGNGTAPNQELVRNGTVLGTGSQILWYHGILYLKGNDGIWYSWLVLTGFTPFGASDPETGGGIPTGYFVARTGDDTRSCSTAMNILTPKATIASGMACPSAGETTYVRGGNYDESFSNPSLHDGTSWASKVRIAAYPGETVNVIPSGAPAYVLYINQTHAYIEWDGINWIGTSTVNGVIKFETDNSTTLDPHHLRVQNGIAQGNLSALAANGPQGITTDAQAVARGGHEFINMTVKDIGGADFSHAFYIKTPDTLTDGNDVSNFPGAGIHYYQATVLGDGTVLRMNGGVIRNNRVHDGRATAAGQRHWGIDIADGTTTSALVYNNTIWNIPVDAFVTYFDRSFGIQVSYNSGVSLYNNTTYGGGQYGINVASVSSSITSKNNLGYQNAAGDAFNGTGSTSSNNSSGVDPLFNNVSTQDFCVQAGSLAVDSGTPVSSVFTTAADGTPRPQGAQWDRGACER